MSPRKLALLCGLVTFAGLMVARLATRDAAVAAPPSASFAADAPAKQWFKGNLHTHSLWSDGDEFPERIAAWYRDQGYHFLAISDHNTLQQGDKWVRSADLKKKGAGPATEQYLKDFADLARTRGDLAGAFEVRLTPFAEYKPRLDQPGRFLLIPSEEVSAKYDQPIEPAPEDPKAPKVVSKPIHICATNLTGDAIKPLTGESVVDVIRKNFQAIEEQGKKMGVPVLPHLNHPNFRWGVTAEEMAAVLEDRFFEVYNGHPQVGHEGDATRPGVEKMWDIANTIRMTQLDAPPMYGVGTDDTHHYHVTGMSRSTAGRGWIHVRSASLSAEALIDAMKAGDFYASSGVTLEDVRFDRAAGTVTIRIKPDGDAKFTTRFIGTPKPADGKTAPPDSVGTVFATVEGTTATYTLTGKELYVRATVTSDQAAANPSFKDQKKQAWTQPVAK